MTVEEYAIDLLVSGTEHVAEDDLNEDDAIADHLHREACGLAIDIAHAIRDNPQVVLDLVARVREG